MTQPILSTAHNGRNWITFEDHESPQWRSAIEWLLHAGFVESGASVIGIDEGILPSYLKQGVAIAAGFDTWSGSYLLAECEQGDHLLLRLAEHVLAIDRRSLT